MRARLGGAFLLVTAAVALAAHDPTLEVGVASATGWFGDIVFRRAQ